MGGWRKWLLLEAMVDSEFVEFPLFMRASIRYFLLHSLKLLSFSVILSECIAYRFSESVQCKHKHADGRTPAE